MSWGEPFSGSRSCFSDSYHRLAIAIPFSSIQEDTHLFCGQIKELVQHGVRHIAFIANDAIVARQAADLYSAIIGSVLSIFPRSRFAVTVFVQSQDPYKLLRSIDEIILGTICPSPNAVVVGFTSNREQTSDQLRRIFGMISETQIVVGLQGAPSRHDIEFIIHSISPEYSLRLYNVGNAKVPNFNTRMIDFSISKHMDVYCFLSRKDMEDPNSSFSYMAKKYNKSIAATISKAVLQLGCIVCMDVRSIAEIDWVDENLSLLAHPFTHRKEYIAPTDIIHFQIDDGDMELVSDASEALESSEDEIWMPLISGIRKPTPLKY